ncbi:MAG: hypothetical protein A2487_07625 [Candidatus Raymondbacteria bacterium RifOxyC12_full_50_8]|uniref:RNA polymerase sigma-70 region 4 domain-containing protein n=1 Tax=Candidatus Raymondbacteria bacterium RIFOXYD12_FULL_49_13 TaxID=1817890 RepID=A0A1F7F6Y3_UNCRA|nr:MAG: hypothetical protein A2248_13325 [Candidatus Raymondbacteria bacterium RIFOXYA2_FULL_49_16]OGJ95404.1 MAG: hypothetical protein A2350_20990 [Candidatus Raymondbacteria bacterium RifOxyB12_full_50_8]OGJ99296.1 MAG: hypothetical protein A2487_07625 [Candidatus Raymondbacteria bacterium RifOxyC12_full_50_8]OGK02266.1 MAG: hypothetical protein A2519_16440 [Candidatus Raymondbacteria bacterium RIFOXYD12_FULL_49_13]OGP45120.1 MAG: hypothetical protein A2324_12030 [Candidatus Raymondbacteria b
MYYKKPAVKNEEKHVNIEEMIGTLTSPEKLVISSYFGLNEKEALTLEQVEKKLNISEERVRQLKNNALDKMKHAFQTVQIAYCT